MFCRALFDGGAVFARKAVQDKPVPADSVVLKVKLSASQLSNNTAMRGSGGALNLDGAHLMLGAGVIFQYNEAAADGGAFAVYALTSDKLQDADAGVAPGCISTWDQGIAALNISQQGVVFNNNTARRAGGAGFIGNGVQCNTSTVLSQNRAAAGSNSAGSSHVFQMHGLCDAGYEWQATVGACVRCSFGAYKMLADVNESTACTPCSASAGYLCFGGDRVLPLPHYWMHDYRSSVQGLFSAASTNTATPKAYWCPGHAACPGCSFNCSAGYRGRLCSECAAGYSSPTPFKCTACGNTARANLAISTVATVVIVYVLWIAAWCTCSTDESFFGWGDVLKQVVWFCQALVIVGRSSEFAWAGFARNFWSSLAVVFAQGELGAVPAIQCLWGAALTAKLPWGMWRGLLSAILIVIWVASLVFVHFVVVGALSLCGVRAKRMRWAEATGCCGVCRYTFKLIGVAVGLDLSSEDWWAELQHRLRMLAYVVLGFFYPVLLRISLNSFVCIDVQGTQYWSVDMSMTCWKGQHLGWMIGVGAIAGFLLVVAMPIFYTFTWLASKGGSDHSTAQQHACDASLLSGGSAASSQEVGAGTQGIGNTLFEMNAPCLRRVSTFAVVQGRLSGVDRVRQYLYGVYRERCKAWEGLLQMRLVALVSISVASPIMGPYYTLLAYGALLAAMMVWHDLQKPYKDLCLQQLQTLAYLVLLTNVSLGIVVVTAASRPGPRPASTMQLQPDAPTVGAQHCPYQQGGDPDSSKTVIAASVLMVLLNALFWAVACLVIYSLLTREKRGKNLNDQLLQFATDNARFWILGLGCNTSSRLGIPVVHTGYWTTAGKAESPVPLDPQAKRHCWPVTAWMFFCGWICNIIRTAPCSWPAEGPAVPSQQPADTNDSAGQVQVQQAAEAAEAAADNHAAAAVGTTGMQLADSASSVRKADASSAAAQQHHASSSSHAAAGVLDVLQDPDQT
jgi:hypothetical protein